MQCIKCNSPRIIKFLDGFGEHRIFCRTCLESLPVSEFNHLKEIRRLSEFGAAH